VITVRDLDALDTPAVVVALRPAPHATDSAAQRPLDSSPTGPSSPAEQRAALGQWCTAPGADARSSAAVPGGESSASARPAVDAWPTPSSAGPPGRLARHRRRCLRRRRSRAEQRAAPPGPPGSTRPPAVASRWRSGRPWRWPSPRERQPRGDVDLDPHEGGPDAVKRRRQDVGQHERHCSGAVHPASMPGFSCPPIHPRRCGTRGCRPRQIAAPSATQAQPRPTREGVVADAPTSRRRAWKRRQPAVSVVASRDGSERP